MKASRLVACFALVIGLAGCSASDMKEEPGKTTEPGKASEQRAAMPDVVGKRLDVALDEIKSAGFENEVDVSSTGTFGVVDESNWTVCEQTPAAGKPVTSAPELAVDRSCGDEQDPSMTTTTSAAPSTTAAPVTAEVMTTANNADLAAVLLEGNYCNDSIAQFAAKYQGRTIEFDGNVSALGPHGNARTRFDILVYAGDFSETSAVGPAFQFRDVNLVSDLGLTGPNIPDPLVAGTNLRFKAEVGDYEASSCLFLLTPVATTAR
jgi:hypothetical protein